MQDKQKQLFQMLDLVDKAQRILENNESDLDEFGKMLDMTWRLKRQTGSKISTDTIDALYDKAVQAGALGGKLLGAGGGGFLLFYVRPDRQDNVRKALSDLMEVPFKFERSGTRVIYYTPEFFDKNSSIEG